MSAGDAARRYLNVAEQPPVHAIMSTDWRSMPAMVKRYRRESARPVPRSLNTLLRSACGLTRYQWGGPVWPFPLESRYAPGRALRPVPAGGGFSSSEVYLVGALDGLGTGAYHYDCAADALDPVRRGATPADLGLPGVGLCMVITGVAGRLTFRYAEFGYRLACLNAGVVTGQLLSVLEAPWRGEALLRFDDAAVGDILGLDPAAEIVLAMVPVAGFSTGTQPAGHAPEAAAPTARTCPPRVHDSVPLTSALLRASKAAGAERLPPPPSLTGLDWMAAEALAHARPRLANGVPERSTWYGRFSTTPMSRDQLAAIVSAAGSWRGEVGPEHTLMFALVHRVDGVPSGRYVHDRKGHRLCRLRPTPRTVAVDPRDLAPVKASRLLGDDGAAVGVYVAGDYTGGLSVAGDRWYQMLNLAAGITIQRICLTAAGLGLGTRVQCSYDADQVADLLGLPERIRPLCQVLVGRTDTPVTYTQPIDERHTR